MKHKWVKCGKWTVCKMQLKMRLHCCWPRCKECSRQFPETFEAVTVRGSDFVWFFSIQIFGITKLLYKYILNCDNGHLKKLQCRHEQLRAPGQHKKRTSASVPKENDIYRLFKMVAHISPQLDPWVERSHKPKKNNNKKNIRCILFAGVDSSGLF